MAYFESLSVIWLRSLKCIYVQYFISYHFFFLKYTHIMWVWLFTLLFLSRIKKKKKMPDNATSIDRSIDRSGSEVQRGHRSVYRFV